MEKETIEMDSVLLKNVKRGEFIRRKVNSKTTYIRGEYVRDDGRYSLINFDDINKEVFLKGDTKVFINFTF